MPVKGERSCARCHRSIKRTDKWHAIGSLIFHKDCKDPELLNRKVVVQLKLEEVA